MSVIIDGTNGITSPDIDVDGSTAPANGVYRPAANTLGFSTNSTERMRIGTNGSVTWSSTGTGGDVYLLQNTQPSAEVAIRFDSNQNTSGTAIKLSNSSALNLQSTIRISGSSSADAGIVMYTGQTAGGTSTSGTQSFFASPTFLGTLSPNVGLGYGTGAGGTVTQATSKSTAVTLNKPTGQITMNNAALNANTAVTFQVTNSLCASADTVIVNVVSGFASYTSYSCEAIPNSGLFFVVLRNTTGGSLSEAVVINFAIIKGATA